MKNAMRKASRNLAPTCDAIEVTAVGDQTSPQTRAMIDTFATLAYSEIGSTAAAAIIQHIFSLAMKYPKLSHAKK